MLKVYNTTDKLPMSQKLEEYKLKTDWIGRPYYQFEIPNEFFESEQTLNSYVWSKINEIYFIFTQGGIDSILYPITYIDYKGMSCLVVFSTDLKPIESFGKWVKWSMLLSVVSFALYQLISVFK